MTPIADENPVWGILLLAFMNLCKMLYVDITIIMKIKIGVVVNKIKEIHNDIIMIMNIKIKIIQRISIIS